MKRGIKVINLDQYIMDDSNILVVVDDTDDVELLTDAFNHSCVKDIGYVNSATEAFRYLDSISDKNNLPRLILLDFYLSVVTGVGFINNLKGIKEYEQIHVVVLLSKKSEREIERLKQLGVNSYFVKPFSY